MEIWVVYEKHIEKEGEQLVAVVVSSSEKRTREMLSEKTVGWFDPLYGKTDWMSSDIAICKSIGSANPDEQETIIIFRPIKHNLVFGPRHKALDELFQKAMRRDAKKKDVE